jgi:hypothetical protein
MTDDGNGQLATETWYNAAGSLEDTQTFGYGPEGPTSGGPPASAYFPSGNSTMWTASSRLVMASRRLFSVTATT